VYCVQKLRARFQLSCGRENDDQGETSRAALDEPDGVFVHCDARLPDECGAGSPGRFFELFSPGRDGDESLVRVYEDIQLGFVLHVGTSGLRVGLLSSITLGGRRHHAVIDPFPHPWDLSVGR
jgi:hypothetical protein